MSAKLAAVIREHAEQIIQQDPRRPLDHDSHELVRVLARIIEGKPIEKAFGAPGDWGYNTAIGKALAEYYRS